MSFAIWALIIGALLTTMALSGTSLMRLPISTAMLYLAAGFALGPAGWAILTPDPWAYSAILEILAKIAVLISLFAVGLKLGRPLSDKGWHLPVRLAFISMAITVLLIAASAMWGLGLSLGAAVLLGAIIAPTDPVLASDVQVTETSDRDRLRFGLTAEGGLNDGVAFPFVMLGLGLLGLHDLGTAGWRWLALDVAWAIVGGLLLGWALGMLIGRLVVYLRSQYKESVGFDEFLALGLIALAYGTAELLHANGFLAVFAAGLALQRANKRTGGNVAPPVQVPPLQSKQADEALATHSKYASAYMMQAVQGFNEQLERIAEVAIVLVVGAMLSYTYLPAGAVWFMLFLFVVVRPLAVWLGLLGAAVSRDQRILISWFGIRGIGSIYYLMYAINHGLPRSLAEEITALTLSAVAVSIVVHGISVTPLMALYARRKSKRADR